MVSHGSRSVRASVRSGCASRRARAIGATSPRMRGRERRHAEPSGNRVGALVQAGLDRLEVGEQPAARIDQVPPVGGQHHPASDPFEQRHPRLALQSLDLLGDRARRVAQSVGGGHDRTVGGNGAQRGDGGEIDHEATVPRSVHKDSLVLHRADGLAWLVNRRDSSLAALVATIWGFNFVVIDWGMNGG